MRKGTSVHVYTNEEKEFIKEQYKKLSVRELTKIFNKTFNANLSADAMKSNISRWHYLSGRTGAFPKGHIPDNKGKKWDEYLSKEKQDRCITLCGAFF